MLIENVITDLQAVSSMATVLQDSMETGHLDASLYAPLLADIGRKVENAVKELGRIDKDHINILI